MIPKHVLLVYGGPDDPQARADALLVDLPAAWAALPELQGLVVTPADPALPNPNPFRPGARPVALVDVYGPAWPPPWPLPAFTAHAWRVDESVPTTYGENPHGPAHPGGEGVPSPGLVCVSCLERRPDLDEAAFLAAWHGVMSPVSTALQPRTRYARNHVRAALTPGAPPFAAIVAEAWPDEAAVRSPWRFYGARGPVALVRNMVAILRAVGGMTRPWRVVSFSGREHVLRRPPGWR